jgi:predicted 3-demethylubiquinone-9 3-methyltransferase (glyoxalase superfamily)
MQKIVPFIWFNTNALDAATFYSKIFKKSKISKTTYHDKMSAQFSKVPVGSVLAVDFTLNGQQFTGINGGPIFPQSPAVSLFIHCKTAKDVDFFYNKLSAGGQVMMELAEYPFSKKYAFFKDKYGVSWQVMLSNKTTKIVPSLLFVGKSYGNAQAAVKLYTKIFKKAKTVSMVKYPKDDAFGNKKGTVMHSTFIIEGQEFSAMDGGGNHNFGFNESMSFMILTKDQKETDYYWKALTKNGGFESQCGWCKDKFGVSWQVTPKDLLKYNFAKDETKAARARGAMYQMKKIDINAIKKAYYG